MVVLNGRENVLSPSMLASCCVGISRTPQNADAMANRGQLLSRGGKKVCQAIPMSMKLKPTGTFNKKNASWLSKIWTELPANHATKVHLSKCRCETINANTRISPNHHMGKKGTLPMETRKCLHQKLTFITEESASPACSEMG